jgi:TonB family protein
LKLGWVHFVVIIILTRALMCAQQRDNDSPATLAYENGSIANDIYTNECFGFSLAVPKGWQVNTWALGPNARARHATKGSLILLLVEQPKEGAFGNRIVLNVNDASLFDPTVQEFVSRYARGYVSSDQERRQIVKNDYSVDYGGKRFARADIKQTMSSADVLYMALIYTKFRGYYIGEFVSAASPGELELAVSSLQQISFREDKLNSKCVMTGDDSLNSGGIVGGIISKPILSPSNSDIPQRVRVSEAVSTGLRVTKVEPQYPEVARTARIQGQVVLKALIDKSGSVEEVTLVSGPPMLATAAIEAVKQWKYKPYLLNDQPVKIETLITVSFPLPEH